MRKLFLLFVLSIFFGHIYAQVDTVQKQPYISKIDSAFAPLLADSIPYNILYDRVFPWAGLRTTSSGDTVDFSLMKQAWYELELSRLSEATIGLGQSFVSYNTFRDTAYSSRIKNRVQVAAVAVKMSALDTLAFTDGRLDSTAAGWDRAVGMASPFETKDVTMSALSMDEFIAGKEYEIQLKSDFIQHAYRTAIESVEITEPENGLDITLLPDQRTNFTLSDTGQFYLTLKINFSDDSYYMNIQQIKVESPATPRSTCDRERMIIESDIPFKGPDETVGTTSLADVYFYYHYDENGDCEEFLKKPIIICDGFDPLDERQIKAIKSRFNFTSSSGENIESIKKLRELGFDVIVMNFPVIGSDAVDGRVNVRDENGNLVNKDMRDGGTDYTQRNAMLMVKLIQMVNERLETNGSDEELGIIGPSMGGQVTRYALAYMEEQEAEGVDNMDHNTRVWISFDSPHHGANIPIGNTGLLASLGYTLNQTEALEKFEAKVATNAGQQYLINQAVPELVQTPFINFIDIRLYQNNAAPRRIEYINNLTSNGLPGSEGWPQDVKRVAVANASDKGKNTGTAGEEALYVKVPEIRIPIIGPFVTIKVEVAEFQSFLQVEYQNTNDPIYNAILLDFLSLSHTSEAPPLENKNPPGSLDILPGSIFNSTQEVSDGIIEGLKNKSIKIIESRVKPKHTFMPVISTLAFNDTDIDWEQRLDDRNLVCTGEIPFHEYMISGKNQDHITITEDIFDFVQYQLQYGDIGCPQICGSYSISGDEQICDGNTNAIHTYTLSGTIENGETLTWEVEGDLSIDNINGQTIDLKITATDGSGKVIAKITNNCGDKVEKVFPVTIGTPDITLSSNFNESNCSFSVTMNSIPQGKIPDEYQWGYDGINYSNGSKTIEPIIFLPHEKERMVYGRADWGCGYSTDDILLYYTANSDCYIPLRLEKDKHKWQVYPNPATNKWNIKIPNNEADAYSLVLFDMNNKVIKQKKVSTDRKVIEVDNSNLASGMYIIRIQNKEETISLRALKL